MLTRRCIDQVKNLMNEQRTVKAVNVTRKYVPLSIKSAMRLVEFIKISDILEIEASLKIKTEYIDVSLFYDVEFLEDEQFIDEDNLETCDIDPIFPDLEPEDSNDEPKFIVLQNNRTSGKFYIKFIKHHYIESKYGFVNKKHWTILGYCNTREKAEEIIEESNKLKFIILQNNITSCKFYLNFDPKKPKSYYTDDLDNKKCFTILGYCNTEEEAKKIIRGNHGD